MTVLCSRDFYSSITGIESLLLIGGWVTVFTLVLTLEKQPLLASAEFLHWPPIYECSFATSKTSFLEMIRWCKTSRQDKTSRAKKHMLCRIFHLYIYYIKKNCVQFHWQYFHKLTSLLIEYWNKVWLKGLKLCQLFF